MAFVRAEKSKLGNEETAQRKNGTVMNDNSAEGLAQRKLKAAIQGDALQRVEDEELLQGKMDIQRQADDEEELM